jgi:NAD(P)-dependent dehydrogenase (short-subunit alcohol dehydrogenase family)
LGESVYSACKGGPIAFSKRSRGSARDNVRANVVCPGPTDTALLCSFVGDGEYGQKVYDGLKRKKGPIFGSLSPRKPSVVYRADLPVYRFGALSHLGSNQDRQRYLPNGRGSI